MFNIKLILTICRVDCLKYIKIILIQFQKNQGKHSNKQELRIKVQIFLHKTQFIDSLKIIKKEIELNIKEIERAIYQMEFESPQTFTRWFKKMDGKNPISYKK